MNIHAQELYEYAFGKPEEFLRLNKVEQVELLADQFISLNKKSVSSILLMSLIIYSIHQKTDIFNAFVEKTKLTFDTDSSQFRKYCVIGGNFEKLAKFVNSLPCRWSTIYKLARVDEVQLQELKDAGYLHANVTADEIGKHLPSKVTSFRNRYAMKKLINRVEVRISKDLTDEQMNKVLATLEEMKNRKLIDFEAPRIIQTLEPANDSDTPNHLAA